METHERGYSHTQSAPFCLVLYAMAVGFVVLAMSLLSPPVVQTILFVGGGILLVIAAGFHHLKVVDRGDALAVRFGPLPLFRTSIAYDRIERAEVGRTLLIDGWGIHYSVRRGWVWNIWGRTAVVVHLRNRVVWIGTDDAENLVGFLRSRIAQHSQQVV